MDQIKRRIVFFAGGRTEEREFECAFLDDNACNFQYVEEVHLEQEFTTNEIARFMLLPSINVLKATGLSIMKPISLPDTLEHAPSNLTTLDLDGGELWRIGPSTFHTLLLHCPCLRILRTRVPD